MRGFSVESFLFRMGPAVNRDNRELVLPILPCVHENMNSSYIKSFAVSKLLAASAPNLSEEAYRRRRMVAVPGITYK